MHFWQWNLGVCCQGKIDWLAGQPDGLAGGLAGQPTDRLTNWLVQWPTDPTTDPPNVPPHLPLELAFLLLRMYPMRFSESFPHPFPVYFLVLQHVLIPFFSVRSLVYLPGSFVLCFPAISVCVPIPTAVSLSVCWLDLPLLNLSYHSRRSQSIEIDFGNQSIHPISIGSDRRLLSIDIGNRSQSYSLHICHQKTVLMESKKSREKRNHDLLEA